ncbi:MAG: response regulator [Dehalococcoidia bacterium]
MAESMRVLIADDHPVVMEGLRGLMDTEPDIELIGEAHDGLEAVQLAQSLQPDVILLDLMMPRKDGISAIKEIKENDPDARILVLTSFADDDRVFSAVKAGALGYLLKDTGPEELVNSLWGVCRGEPSLHPTIALKLMRELNDPPADLPPTNEPLTHREEEVLRLIAQGMSNQEMSEQLTVAEATVSKHVSTILGKLHLANRTQAALYALRQGLARLEED